MDLISIIVPVYNVEEYLEQCVESLINQTYSDLEIILVNDGSTDNSPAICNKYAKKDDRIKVIHKQNGGLSDARNTGLNKAQGAYIAFVDSDDWVKPTMLEHLYTACVKYDAEISCCGRYITDGKKISLKRFISKEQCYTQEDALKEILDGGTIDVAAWDKLYKAEIWRELRFPIGENNEDIATFYLVMDKASIVVHCGTVEYYYRNRPFSITKANYNEYDRKIILKNVDLIEQYIKRKFPQLMQNVYTYKSYNIYHLINKYIKSRGADKSEEYYLLKNLLFSYKNYLKKYNSITKKEELITWMIIHEVYSHFLDIKEKFLGHR